MLIQESKPPMFVVAAGLLTTAGLLYLLATILQLGLRLITHGGLQLGLGGLAFAILFYAVATFVAFGTRQRPEHLTFALTNVAVQVAFLCLGWLLLSILPGSFGLRTAPDASLPASWLALAIAFVLLVQGATYGFALLRRELIREHLHVLPATQQGVVERFFNARFSAYPALPFGVVLGAALGSARGASGAELVRHACAGAFASVLLLALAQIGAGCRPLASELLVTRDQARAAIRVLLSKKHHLELAAQAPGHANTHGVEIAAIAAGIRRLLFIDQLQLIAVFAHELAHYLLATAGEWPVCADDEKECLTDLAAVFMGFGVFLANARFSRETYTDGVWHGWRIGHAGYLPEADLIFALALFLRAKGLDADAACDSLKPHLAKLLRRAMHEMPVDHDDVRMICEAIAAADAAAASAAP
jgi:hypothetical protein